MTGAGRPGHQEAAAAIAGAVAHAGTMRAVCNYVRIDADRGGQALALRIVKAGRITFIILPH